MGEAGASPNPGRAPFMSVHFVETSTGRYLLVHASKTRSSETNIANPKWGTDYFFVPYRPRRGLPCGCVRLSWGGSARSEGSIDGGASSD